MATQNADDLSREGREALVAADWERARSCFEQARELEETAEILDGLGQAAHFLGDYQQAIEFKERAFAAYRRKDERVEAAEVARWLAFLYGGVHGNRAAANGWMAWADRLLDGIEESVGHGRVALDRVPWTDDPAQRERHAMAALRVARRFGDRDLEFTAQAVLGHAYVMSGRVAEGMSLIDEAMAAVAGGEVVGIDAIGSIYCRLLGACERATDVRRAEEWIAAARRFVVWGDFVAPTCRLHYGGILMAVGRWAEAEKELLAAARVFERGYRGMRTAPLIRLAGLRVRQGRFEEAERLLEGSESRAPARQLLAEIALGRGDLALAEDRARFCLEWEDVSSPACSPLLELLVLIYVTRDELDAAREALERLRAIATAGADERTNAAANLAAGRLYAAEGDERARSHLHMALQGFSALDLPLEAARTQLELARAVARDVPAAAIAEARVALATFERLGASRDADAAADLLRTLGETAGRPWPKRYGTLTKRETEVLSLLAAGCSNPEIADRLYISRRTAEHHVANILSKLDLRSRAEAAAYAVRERSEIPVGE
jgi:DNA-binding CsgD family transcriptional regulator